ncbi:speckle targeted PIP5K1A-regulated poly(A) polymerase-like [Watersipora subatra]|uniref:speckle targeted PIP5K1A-regulated poly(A) polymerase-like n=1 Tax=Watersipora subatra TaxID=2589382 RepID=UPI00355C7ED7
MPKGNRKWKDGRTEGKGKYSRQNARPYPLSNPQGRQHYSRSSSFNANTSSVSESDIVSSAIPQMANLASLSEQMVFTYEHLSLKPDDHRLRSTFLEMIECHFKLALAGQTPCCYLYAFGSSINELGMKNCDLDMVLLTNGTIKNMWSRPIPNTKSLLNQLINRLYRSQRELGITNIVPIKAARVPLIKFSHLNQDMECDVSFNRRMGVLNSLLISAVMQFSKSAKLLAFTLKLWGKQKGFVGGGGKKMNSYSMTLMVIFFLQQVEVVPPLKYLQCPNNTIEDAEGISFITKPDDLARFKGLMREYEPSELLKGFFAYYIRFPFETSIISVYEGEPLLISERPSFNEQFINIQDPFEKDFNTARGVKEPMRNWFKKCLNLTYAHRAVICDRKQKGQLWGLQYLLQPVEHITNEKMAKAKLQLTAQERSSFACAMADYYKVAGRKLEFDVPYSQTGCPMKQYVRCCVQVVRTLSELYGMSVTAAWSSHPLSDPVRQLVTSNSNPPSGRRENEPFAAVPQFAELQQSKPEDVTKIPLEFYIPFTIQVRNKWYNLLDTSTLKRVPFNYNDYVREVNRSLQKKNAHLADFTITFQPHDGNFYLIDLEVADMNSHYLDAICQHLRTVIPRAIQRDLANS